MKNFKKTATAVLVAAGLAFGLAACDDADVASKNLSKAADNFEVSRQIVFYNGITGQYIAEIDGLCSIKGADKKDETAVICKVGKDKYMKHIISKSDNVTWFELQSKASKVSTSHYRVVFKPSVVVPDVDLR